MRILFSLLDYSQIAGTQMYVYTLAKKLVERGHQCTVISNIGSPMNTESDKAGIKCLPYSELSRLNETDYDIIHASHKPIIEAIIENNILPSIPIVQTCHSEIIPLEKPFIHERVKHYIGIRESIVAELSGSIHYDEIENSPVSLIYNPIDTEIYNTQNVADEKFILFVGSLDGLRKNAFLKTLSFALEQNLKVVHVGRNDYPELEEQYSNICRFLQPIFNPWELTKKCTMTAGIITGRTALEGFLCRKDCFNIEVDSYGIVKRFEVKKPPLYPQLFDSDFVARQMERVYMEAITNRE